MSSKHAASPVDAPSRLIRLAVWGSAILVVLAVGAFYYASRVAQTNKKASPGQAVTVTVSSRSCEPNELTVPAGRTTFQILNTSKRAVEWEILDGVMVVEERENIAPGFTQTLTARLEPGVYAITCGLLSNPRGTLHVVASDASAARAARPPQRAYIGALAEYRVYMMMQSNELAQAVGQLADAVKAGDLQRAKSLYAPTRLAYVRMAPLADMFADLGQRIDARADLFEKRESDSGFIGFHRIEFGLFKQGSTQDLAPVANQLADDIKALQARIRALNVPPERLAHGAASLMRQVSDRAVDGAGNPYSHTDLSDMQGSTQGAKEVVDLLRPLLVKADAPLLERIDHDFKEVDDALQQYRQPDGGYADYTQVPSDGRQALRTLFGTLATDIDKVNTALGLD